jgi:hypothetical protein
MVVAEGDLVMVHGRYVGWGAARKDGSITPPSSAVAIRRPMVGSLRMSISIFQMAKNCMVETGASSRMTLTGTRQF